MVALFATMTDHSRKKICDVSHCHTTCLFNPVQLSPLFTTNLTFLFQLKILVSYTKCDNCCRCQTINDDYTELEFSQHPYSHVRKVQHFRHVKEYSVISLVQIMFMSHMDIFGQFLSPLFYGVFDSITLLFIENNKSYEWLVSCGGNHTFCEDNMRCPISWGSF